MKRWWGEFLVASLLAFCAATWPQAASAATGPVVAVTGGQIQGAALDKGGAVFKGIPFAQPPVDELRWREPMPVKPWTGLREATAFGAPCPQSPEYIRVPGVVAKEDCLYLNVWTPEPGPSKKPLMRPVMVWIPGGGNFFGSGISASFHIQSSRGNHLITSRETKASSIRSPRSDGCAPISRSSAVILAT